MISSVVSKKVIFFGIIVFLLLIWLANCSPEADIAPGNDRFGLCFISDPDHRVDEARYQGGLEAGARWDRWPLYWHWVDEDGYAGSHPGGTHDYDTLVAQDIAHGLTPVVILLGTPARYARTSPDVDQTGTSANTPTLPPASLMEPIFTDGSDAPGPGKAINPANAWAHFVFSTVERYRLPASGCVTGWLTTGRETSVSCKRVGPAASEFAIGKSGMNPISTHFGAGLSRNITACWR